MTERADKLRQELRRGAIVIAVLAALRAEHYGYSLRHALAERGIEVEEGTLYPLVRRLEQQGLLASEWREENKRRKRFYRLAPAGEATLERLLDDWRTLNLGLEQIIGNERRRS
ncbi:MAG: helix-turn-helix transcriptional regulator [Pseudomonadota bacterium]